MQHQGKYKATLFISLWYSQFIGLTFGWWLAAYAENPKLYLDDKGKAKIDQVASELWRRLREALEESTEARLKYQAQCLSDNFGDRPLTPEDLQSDLFDSPDNPF